MKKLFLLFMIMGISQGMLCSQTITVTSPEGGENWKIGSTHTITWTPNGSMDANVKIRLMKGHGGLEDLVLAITESTATTNGSYSWTIPESLTPGSYLIRVKTVDNAVGDDGDFFTVSPALASLTVTYPNGGETWRRGETYTIRWKSSGIKDKQVRVSLRKDGKIIAWSYYPNTGSLKYKIWDNCSLGSNFKIGVASGDNSVYDLSDSNFTILRGFKKPEKTESSASKIRGYPDFIITKELKNRSYSHRNESIYLTIKNIGAPFVGSFKAKIFDLWNGIDIDNERIFTFGELHPFDRNNVLVFVSKKFKWPSGWCYIPVKGIVDIDSEVKELRENNNIFNGKFFPTNGNYKKIWEDKIWILLRKTHWRGIGHLQTFTLNSPDDVIVTTTNTILMDVKFKLICCSSIGTYAYPRLEYYGTRPRMDKIGKIWLSPGKEKVITRRIQIKIRGQGNYIKARVYSGDSWKGCWIKLKFGEKFFE